MSDHHNPPTDQAARKVHICIFCGAGIPVGERYRQQTGFYEGKPYRNRYHQECWTAIIEDGDFEFEFIPYSGAPPDRLTVTEQTP